MTADRPLNSVERRALQFNKGCQNHGCNNRKSQHKMKTAMGMTRDKIKQSKKSPSLVSRIKPRFKSLFGGNK